MQKVSLYLNKAVNESCEQSCEWRWIVSSPCIDLATFKRQNWDRDTQESFFSSVDSRKSLGIRSTMETGTFTKPSPYQMRIMSYWDPLRL